MRKLLMFFLALALMAGIAQAATPVYYGGGSAAPGTGVLTDGDENNSTWDALGGAWDHTNGSDAWDGTGIGVGIPGGASALTEGNTDYLRIQDTGDPRDYDSPAGEWGNPSNRKIWFAHQIDFGLDGARLEFRARIATGAPLDMAHPDGGGGIQAWPAGGIGAPVANNGKGHLALPKPLLTEAWPSLWPSRMNCKIMPDMKLFNPTSCCSMSIILQTRIRPIRVLPEFRVSFR